MTQKPDNQFYFWPNYLDHAGQSAIYVREMERPHFRPDWFSRWWNQQGDLYLPDVSSPRLLPPEIQKEFESITDLGVTNVVADGNVVRRIQLFECHVLKPQTR